MLRGARVGLRARRTEDVALLHEHLYDEVGTRVRTDTKPWVPIPVERSSFRPREDSENAVFSVVELVDGEPLAGAAILWGIDDHNRFAHLGLSLLPAFRGRGLSSDIVAVLTDYAFVHRGLNRLQIETLADNAPMIGAARRNGYVHEATMREAGWVQGAFVDEVVYGLLRSEWVARRSAAPTPDG